MSTSVNNLERKNLAWKISKLICIQEDRISIASFEGTIDTIPTDSYINNLNGVIELSGGYYSFELFALLSNGTIWTNAVSTYDEVRNWNQIKHISVEEQNGSYIAAVDIDGRILLAGWHYPFEDKEKQEIEQWSNLIEICAGYHYVTALTADGRVLCSDAKIQRIVEEWRNIRHIAIDYGNIYAWDDNGKICTTSSDYLQLRSIDDVILLEEKYILLGNGILRDRNFDSNEATILGNVVGCKNIDDIVVIVNGDGSVEINGALKEQYKVQPAINVFYNDKKSEHKSRIDSTRIALTDEEYRFRKRMEEEERKELEELEKQWRQERIIEQEELRRFTERENKEIIRKISTALVVVVGLILMIANGLNFITIIVFVAFASWMTHYYVGVLLGLEKRIETKTGGLSEKIGQALLNLNESYTSDEENKGSKFMSGVGQQDEQYVRVESGRYRFVEDRYGNEKKLTKIDGAWYDDEDNRYDDL